jgi:hypothetical protein
MKILKNLTLFLLLSTLFSLTLLAHAEEPKESAQAILDEPDC